MGPSGGGDRGESAPREIPHVGSEHPTRRVPQPFSRGDTSGPLPTTDHRGDGRRSGRLRCRPDGAGRHGQTPGDLAARGQVLHHPLGIPGLLQLLPARHLARHRGPDHRNTQRHPQPCPGEPSATALCMLDYLRSGARWYGAPKPMLLDALFEVDLTRPTPRNDEPAFDAANVLRLGRDLIYLVSSTGNEMGGNGFRSSWETRSGSTSSRMSTSAATSTRRSSRCGPA